ncbi:uncharacterized protein K02A2.6-like [Camellia sinensis]|uniref:uncharacterized protein K02A2.6-like n=1 Tax=Camellia sinensis TaxID=4442 RepID=UPI001036C75F|nr:uncharacterized protein K02A2.6-like [Camellia sinensis]
MATLGAKVEIPDDSIAIVIEKRITPAVLAEEHTEQDAEGWKTYIIQQLKTGQGTIRPAELASFSLLRGELYFCGPNNLLKFGNLIHALAVELHNIKTPYPFHTWAFDLVSPIAQQSKGHRWILAVTEVSTKWVQTIPIRKVDGARVANFIKENIICRFGIPKVMLSNNGTPFVNRHAGRLLDAYQIKHQKSSPYYPQGNGQAEATNKTLIRILSKMMDEAGDTWSEQLSVALWAYRTSKRKPTQATPFSLVYGSEAVFPVELAVPSARMAMSAHLVPGSKKNDIEAVEERRDRASRAMEKYHQSITRAHNQSVQHKKFKKKDLVWKTVDPIMRGNQFPSSRPDGKAPTKLLRQAAAGTTS